MTLDPAIRDDEVVIATLRPLTPTGPALVCVATRDLVLPHDDPDAPNREYLGLLVNSVALGREMWSEGRIVGSGGAARGGLRVLVDDDSLPAQLAWRGWGWDHRPAEIATIRPGEPWAQRVVIWRGESTGLTATATAVDIALRDPLERLERPWQAAKYAGTGGFEGGAELTGVEKPRVCGRVRGVSPVEVDPVGLWYDLDPVHGLASVQAVYTGANPLNITTTNPPPSGHVYVDLAGGRIRTWMRPEAPLTVDCTGAYAGGATTPAPLVAAILTEMTTATLDTPALAAAGTDSPFVTGWYASRGETAREVVDHLLTDCGGAWIGTTRQGLVTLGRLVPPQATHEDDPRIRVVLTDADLQRAGLTLRPEPSPPAAVDLGWGRCWTVLEAQDLRGSNGAAQQFHRAPYRRLQVPASAAVQALHPQAEPWRVDTGLLDPGHAATVAARLATIACAERLTVEASAALPPLALELGDEVWVRSDLYHLDAAFVVRAISETTGGGRPVLTLWR